MKGRDVKCGRFDAVLMPCMRAHAATTATTAPVSVSKVEVKKTGFGQASTEQECKTYAAKQGKTFFGNFLNEDGGTVALGKLHIPLGCSFYIHTNKYYWSNDGTAPCSQTHSYCIIFLGPRRCDLLVM